MIFASVCSGIEAASVAFDPLGWEPAFFSEIEAFPREVLRQRLRAEDVRRSGAAARGVPLFGDFTAIRPRHLRRLGVRSPELLIGGTPCQAFSFAGARKSLQDPRGALTLGYVRLVHAIRTLRWAVWENVPGVLSLEDNAFGHLLGGLVGADHPLPCPEGGSWPDAGMVAGPRMRAAWRVLDTQYFGLPQRRRRVFIVASPGAAGGDPARVLFERKGMSGDAPKGRLPWSQVARTLVASSGGDSGKERHRTFIGRDGQPLNALGFALRGREGGAQVEVEGDRVGALRASAGGSSCSYIAFTCKDYGADAGEVAPTLRAMGFTKSHANAGGQIAVTAPEGVRRLTSRETERLQGFADDWTRIAFGRKGAERCPDGPRQRATGNSFSVPVVRWIGERIQEQEAAA